MIDRVETELIQYAYTISRCAQIEESRQIYGCTRRGQCCLKYVSKYYIILIDINESEIIIEFTSSSLPPHTKWTVLLLEIEDSRWIWVKPLSKPMIIYCYIVRFPYDTYITFLRHTHTHTICIPYSPWGTECLCEFGPSSAYFHLYGCRALSSNDVSHWLGANLESALSKRYLVLLGPIITGPYSTLFPSVRGFPGESTHWPQGRCGSKLQYIILFIPNISSGTQRGFLPRCMPRNLTDEKSKLIQVMACCCQAISHYLNQCWTWSLSPYGVNKLRRLRWYQCN